MDKFDLSKFGKYHDLPLSSFNKVGYSIYVLDKNWDYLFINDFVANNLGGRSHGLISRNMWEVFPELANNSDFMTLRSNTEKGIDTNLVTISPLNAQRLNITGHPLSDCFIFTSSIIPKKEEILDELRRKLGKEKTF